jgi:hypothetical protein
MGVSSNCGNEGRSIISTWRQTIIKTWFLLRKLGVETFVSNCEDLWRGEIASGDVCA